MSTKSSCQKSRDELAAIKQKIALNYKKWLSATRMASLASKALKKSNAVYRKVNGATKEACTNGGDGKKESPRKWKFGPQKPGKLPKDPKFTEFKKTFKAVERWTGGKHP